MFVVNVVVGCGVLMLLLAGANLHHPSLCTRLPQRINLRAEVVVDGVHLPRAVDADDGHPVLYLHRGEVLVAPRPHRGRGQGPEEGEGQPSPAAAAAACGVGWG